MNKNKSKIKQKIQDSKEELEALSSKRYINSIKKAREEIKQGHVYTHGEVFGES